MIKRINNIKNEIHNTQKKKIIFYSQLFKECLQIYKQKQQQHQEFNFHYLIDNNVFKFNSNNVDICYISNGQTHPTRRVPSNLHNFLGRPSLSSQISTKGDGPIESLLKDGNQSNDVGCNNR